SGSPPSLPLPPPAAAGPGCAGVRSRASIRAATAGRTRRCRVMVPSRNGFGTVATVPDVVHLFKVAGFPGAVERRRLWPVDAERGEPAAAGGRLNPPPFLAGRTPRPGARREVVSRRAPAFSRRPGVGRTGDGAGRSGA